MNALYDFFLTPQPKDSNKTRYHARLVVRDTITLEDIAETIESRSSLRQSDVIGSFIEFANVFKQELSNGNSIHIPGIGSFRIKAESRDIEIDGRLAEFFKDNPCITTQQLCSLCGLRKATALRRLQKRVDEGKLTHPGYIRSPFYFPVPGWFGVSRNR